MVIEELESELKSTIKKYGVQDKRTYHICKIISIEKDKKYNNNALQNYYLDSIVELIKYMKVNEKNPSESRWDKYAIQKECLSSKTIGYMYENGFNDLCRNIRKRINKKFLL